MKSNYVFPLLLTMGILFSCKKDKSNLPPVVPPPSDAQTVLLKDVVEQNLPSPYYHFEYNDSGYITSSGFSSGLRSYDISYAAKRIGEIRSTHIINKDRLVYRYENGKVFLVQYFDQAGVNYKRCFLSYTAAGQLLKMEWELKLGTTGFASERTLSFTYHPDGNLFELKDHRHALGQQAEDIHIDRYENYDNKVNVDGFALIHDNNDHLILLPGIKLQKNNPQQNIRTGDGIHYQITYSYTYNELNRPVQKNGDALITGGPDAGKHFQTHTTFTYYP